MQSKLIVQHSLADLACNGQHRIKLDGLDGRRLSLHKCRTVAIAYSGTTSVRLLISLGIVIVRLPQTRLAAMGTLFAFTRAGSDHPGSTSIPSSGFWRAISDGRWLLTKNCRGARPHVVLLPSLLMLPNQWLLSLFDLFIYLRQTQNTIDLFKPVPR
jgi:hypothetical protein